MIRNFDIRNLVPAPETGQFQQNAATFYQTSYVLTWDLTVAVEKKASQFKQNAATGYETSVYIILTLGPGNLVEVEKEARQFQQNAAILYQTSVNCTNLGTWLPRRFGREEEGNRAVPAECRNFLSNILVKS